MFNQRYATKTKRYYRKMKSKLSDVKYEKGTIDVDVPYELDSIVINYDQKDFVCPLKEYRCPRLGRRRGRGRRGRGRETEKLPTIVVHTFKDPTGKYEPFESEYYRKDGEDRFIGPTWTQMAFMKHFSTFCSALTNWIDQEKVSSASRQPDIAAYLTNDIGRTLRFQLGMLEDDDKEIPAMVKRLRKVFSKSRFIPPGCTLFQGYSYTYDEEFSNIRIGDILSNSLPMSTSPDINVAMHFSPVDHVIFVHTIKEHVRGFWMMGAIDLDRYTRVKNKYLKEQEILLQPGLDMTIIDIQYVAMEYTSIDYSTGIFMDESSSDDEPDTFKVVTKVIFTELRGPHSRNDR